MRTSSRTAPKVATLLSVEALSRRCHFGRDVLNLTDAALLADLHDYNDRSPHALPSSFVDALLDVFTMAAA